MLTSRVIPFLLVTDGGLVKTRRFKDPAYVGDPINAIRIFNEKEVDELALLDISASANGRGPNFDLVRDFASECFMPLAYGGGVRNLEDAKRLFSLGAEKVILRSAAADPSVLSDIARFSGSQSVAVSVDVRRNRFGGLRLHAPGTPMDGHAGWLDFLRDAAAAGAGEVILNSVDRDGTMGGMDMRLIGQAAQGLTTPLLAVGGVGSLADIRAGLDAGANAIGAGAFFVFHGPRRAVLITYPGFDQIRALLEGYHGKS
jgi:imidazole glycerol-phosphate synthase subunit HisF